MFKRIGLMLCLVLVMGTMLSSCQSQEPTIEFFILRATDQGRYVREIKPILTNEDLDAYDISCHELYLSDNCLSRLREDREAVLEDPYRALAVEANAAHLLGAVYPDKFVVTLDGEEIYTGTFMPPVFSSNMPDGIVMSDTDQGVAIRLFGFNQHGPDKRSDERLLAAFESMNLLRN